jgi:hypothetical protein
MGSLRDETARKLVVQRLQGLTPATKPKWGRMDASRVLCHLGDTLAMAVGDVPTQPMNRKAFHRFPLKHLILYVLPFPKGAPTAPELLSTAPGNFDADRQRVLELIDRLAAAPDTMGPENPFFGPLTNEEWNALQWKHLDHHLRQFGC